MKVLCVLAVSLILLAASVLNAAAISERTLIIEIPFIEREHVPLEHYRGKKPLYIKFWASWCQTCLKEMPHFQHSFEQYGSDIEFISVNVGLEDTVDTVQSAIKTYGLTMPQAIDSKGALAKHFRFQGTPYHLLLDKELNVVHAGHSANSDVDRKLALLASNTPLEFLSSERFNETEGDIDIDFATTATHILYFSAAWCHWYLEKSRPQTSQACIQNQLDINDAYTRLPKTLTLHSVLSRLWTDDEALAQYRHKFNVKHPLVIDKSNALFFRYQITALPTFVVIRDGKEVARYRDFNTIPIQ
ncbi:redoxin domain-containing protein [Teredinibacter purpureus]|uniref:redoxin domain-containing protein n=1 Tax=Teredinibacter purpureus TaxID=2731756 RepID=UPI0005F7C36D|nr:redoxin domain-containing protein [Teredinibacter purpureus]